MTLFPPDQPLGHPTSAQSNQPETARLASLEHPAYRAGLRGRILEAWFGGDTRQGYTDEQLTMLLDRCYPQHKPHHYPSVGKRRGELVELGWIEMWIDQDHPLTRLTTRGSLAQVWRLTRSALAHGWPPEEDR